MDHHLTQPIHPEDLAAALAGLVGDGRAATIPGGSAGSAPAAEAGFDLTAALNYVGGDRELLDELLGIFPEDAPVRMNAIRRPIAGGGTPEFMGGGPTLKGSLKGVGAATAAGQAPRPVAVGAAGG